MSNRNKHRPPKAWRDLHRIKGTRTRAALAKAAIRLGLKKRPRGWARPRPLDFDEATPNG